jgi:predicted PurR-regulated permease PerM
MTAMDIDLSRLRRRALRVWLAVGAVALTWAAWKVFGPVLAVVVPPILVAVVIVYLLNPIVSGLADRGLHRFLGTACAYLLVVAVAVLVTTVGLPLLSEQATSIWEQAPESVDVLLADAEEWLDARGLGLQLDSPLSSEDLPEFDSIVNNEEARSAIAAIVGGISGLATGLLRFVLVVLLGPVIAFYMLVDLPRLRTWTMRHLPPDYRLEASLLGRELSGVIGGYLRGQLLVALFVGTAVSFAMWLIDLPYWLVVGIVAGLTKSRPAARPLRRRRARRSHRPDERRRRLRAAGHRPPHRGPATR